jgi:hypothetical protein
MVPLCGVVGPSPRSGVAVAPPRSRLSPSPGVGRGGDRRPRSRLSPSPRVGRGGDHCPRSRLSSSPGVGRGGDRLPESRLSPSPGVGRGGDRLPESRLSPSPRVGRGGDCLLERGRVRALGSGEAETVVRGEVESELGGRARRRSSSEVEVDSEPWGRARRRFLWRPRLDLAAVSLTLAGGTAVGAAQAALFSCQVSQWRGEVTAVTSALSTRKRALG